MYAPSGNKHFFTKSCHVRPTKIKNRANKNWTHKVFQKSKFSKTFLYKSWSPKSLFFFGQFLTQKNDFESMNFEIFKEVVHNLGKSDDDII